MLNTYNPTFNRVYDEIIKKLDICGVIPLIHIDDPKNALPLAGALLGADITAIEITFRSSCAADVIRTISAKCPNLIVGAGTVITVKQVHEAVNAGAKYIVTPSFNAEVVDRCIEIGVPVFPGCSTATDIDHAFARGLRVVKFFPSELLGGVPMIKALSAPYPFMKFIPTGGINLGNLTDYLSFNKVLCCAGTFIASEKNLETRNFAEIARIARAAIEKVMDLRLDHIAINTDSPTSLDMMKSLCQLAGVNYDSSVQSVLGLSADANTKRSAIGYIVYTSPNIERCLYYLKNRGFYPDETSIVKENNRISEVFLLSQFGNFEIKIVKR